MMAGLHSILPESHHEGMYNLVFLTARKELETRHCSSQARRKKSAPGSIFFRWTARAIGIVSFWSDCNFPFLRARSKSCYTFCDDVLLNWFLLKLHLILTLTSLAECRNWGKWVIMQYNLPCSMFLLSPWFIASRGTQDLPVSDCILSRRMYILPLITTTNIMYETLESRKGQ